MKLQGGNSNATAISRSNAKPWTCKLIAVSVATAPLIVFAAPAHADDQSYLDMLKHNGFALTNEATPGMLSVGHAICKDLEAGVSVDVEIASLERAAPDKLSNRVGQVVKAAQLNLCKDTLK